MAQESKRTKLQLEKEDRISALPDSLIQHILALLPSTKEAIRTGVLSKRWHNHWTQVPVLIFDDSGMSHENFSRFIDNTLHLHDCSKIQKFHIQSKRYKPCTDPLFNSKLRFAIRKNAEELVLKSASSEFLLPDFLFYHASLLKLHIYGCEISRNGSVRWEQLRELTLEHVIAPNSEIENIVTGSPLLELFELIHWDGITSPPGPVISSKSLKKLVLNVGEIYDEFQLEISCPKLEELKLLGGDWFGRLNFKFKDVSSLICTTLDFGFNVGMKNESLVETLQQLQHVNELTLGRNFIQILESLEHIYGLDSPLLNNKSLTLDCPDFDDHPGGIAYALRIFPKLEKLVIKDPVYWSAGLSTKYWNSKVKTLKSSLSHLKTVHIVGLRKKCKCKIPLGFVDFLLKNAPVMEKLLVLKDR